VPCHLADRRLAGVAVPLGRSQVGRRGTKAADSPRPPRVARRSGRLFRKAERRENPLCVQLYRDDMGWTAYILKSLKTGTYYKGSCEIFAERLRDHNAGRVRSTKAKKPWVRHYTEEFDTKTEALKRERYFKSRSGYRRLKSNGII